MFMVNMCEKDIKCQCCGRNRRVEETFAMVKGGWVAEEPVCGHGTAILCSDCLVWLDPVCRKCGVKEFTYRNEGVAV